MLVTGASRGIGAEAARRLAKLGARVSLVGLEPDLLAQVAAEIGPGAAWFEADVADWDALQQAVDATVERIGGIDVVADSLRAEIAQTGTRVGVAYFSFIDTDMVREGLDSPAAKALRDSTPGPFSKTAPLSAAGKAIERGVARRANQGMCRAGCCR